MITHCGRKPTAQNKAAEIMAMVDQGITKPAIAEQVGVSVASVYNIIKKEELFAGNDRFPEQFDDGVSADDGIDSHD